MQALLYLQTELAQVTGSVSQTEFLSCMGYLLSAQHHHGQDDDDAVIPSEDEMVASQLLRANSESQGKVSLLSSANHSTIDMPTWRRRTKVFEELLAFLPEDAVQPHDDLVSCTSAWETLL